MSAIEHRPCVCHALDSEVGAKACNSGKGPRGVADGDGHGKGRQVALRISPWLDQPYQLVLGPVSTPKEENNGDCPGGNLIAGSSPRRASTNSSVIARGRRRVKNLAGSSRQVLL
ncbi:hypothetical protein OF83DRAFT_1111013 [Amylostereum chailletii]|nr:hypothetical protein OF83DRAFT_1111013 [Amylostereum chailletii]